ncbi:hypothetical protein M427DRAFT_477152 [Gonapodya prolifera JEL478]|uniref:Uncharacterized protein n=1 Tax=Gonapodya prolifera (strain JEL478) TaxID=1344416 RepID=A0A139A1H9_GONPJ|nr:hypothetical protein M427DRAFT_477152 [Gonapodya prolifera JEL478]|eukprot:KXS10478.1 hypothetical protein M427DRAFT_477152 [Gonapodya prolifera JEL478]
MRGETGGRCGFRVQTADAASVVEFSCGSTVTPPCLLLLREDIRPPEVEKYAPCRTQDRSSRGDSSVFAQR